MILINILVGAVCFILGWFVQRAFADQYYENLIHDYTEDMIDLFVESAAQAGIEIKFTDDLGRDL